ncbi:MAG: HD domain-containing phosphohydrolase, partial [Planctomycetota bacterium]
VIAEALGCDPCFVSQIGMAAPLHDIGKIGVPDAVLLKPGRFTPEERREMERHVEIGGDIVRSLEVGNDDATRSPMLAMAMRIAMTHHEWFDGTGYPKGLAGEDIPLEGRITAIADVFDALTNERPYKPAFGLTKTLRILGEGRGRQFDPDVFDAFLRSLDRIVDLRYGDGATEGDE